jgi:hypothetical protein
VQYAINFSIPKASTSIQHHQPILMIGSCFTENICKKLVELKYDVCQNPHGIIFNPVSVAACLRDVARGQLYTQAHLFELNDGWHSWLHHSRFSAVTPDEALSKMNEAIQSAHQFCKGAEWMIITLGSAFAYRLNDLDMHVSNNHRAPHQWFTKELLEVPFIVAQLKKGIAQLRELNKNLKVIFTISPVRHLRDGVIDNNRSKARLIEAVHQLCSEVEACSYFPSYEIVIDELRDYRFYDIDLAHPNYQATNYVWQRFVETCIDDSDTALLGELEQIRLALQHRPFNPHSEAHRQFVSSILQKIDAIAAQRPHIDFSSDKIALQQQLAN